MNWEKIRKEDDGDPNNSCRKEKVKAKEKSNFYENIF